MPVRLDRVSASVTGAEGLPQPDYILPNGRGVGYGLFELDSASLEYLLTNAPSIPDSSGFTSFELWVLHQSPSLSVSIEPPSITLRTLL